MDPPPGSLWSILFPLSQLISWYHKRDSAVSNAARYNPHQKGFSVGLRIDYSATELNTISFSLHLFAFSLGGSLMLLHWVSHIKVIVIIIAQGVY